MTVFLLFSEKTVIFAQQTHPFLFEETRQMIHAYQEMTNIHPIQGAHSPP